MKYTLKFNSFNQSLPWIFFLKGHLNDLKTSYVCIWKSISLNVTCVIKDFFQKVSNFDLVSYKFAVQLPHLNVWICQKDEHEILIGIRYFIDNLEMVLTLDELIHHAYSNLPVLYNGPWFITPYTSLK